VDFKTFYLAEAAVKLVWKKKDASGLPFFFKGKRQKGKWVFKDPDKAFVARLEIVGNRFKKAPKPTVKRVSAKEKIEKQIRAKRTAKKSLGKKSIGQERVRKIKARLKQKVATLEQK